eukprot:3937993-Rhodomonas_salina.1
MNEADTMDLPRVTTPTSEAPPALVWNFSGMRSLSRECSLLGTLSLSREQSRDHTFGFHTSGPATNDTTASDAVTEDAISSEAETEACESWSGGNLDEPFSGDVPQPPADCDEEDVASQREMECEYAEPASLKRKYETEEAVACDYAYEPVKRPRKLHSAVSGKRGAHVKERPQMQKNARDGQKHWGNMVLALRAEWNEKRMWEQHEQFHEQIKMCTRLHIKSQHECFLRQLQMALVEGLIRLVDGKDFSADDTQSFLGWTAFEVVPSRGAEFRRRVEEMFANPPQDKTLNNTLRRAGLVPERGWGEAWSGVCAFVFDAQKRAQYSGKE